MAEGKVSKIVDLVASASHVLLQVIVLELIDRSATIARLKVADETGSVTMTLVERCVQCAAEITPGDILRVEGQAVDRLMEGKGVTSLVFTAREPDTLHLLGAFTMRFSEMPDRSAPAPRRAAAFGGKPAGQRES